MRGGARIMDTLTQHIIVIGLVAIAIICAIMHYEQALLIIIGILGGFVGNKTMTEKQAETLSEYQLNHVVPGEDDE